jgi:hypothetical protein
MAFVPRGGASKQARARRAEDQQTSFDYMNMMATDGQLITSSDVKEISKSKGYPSRMWSEADVQLDTYAPVLAALLGNAHP